MPFGQNCEFKDFAACKDKMTGKVEDPDAYCAVLMRKTEAHCKGKFLLPLAVVKTICPSCAEHMEFLNLTALNLDQAELTTLFTRVPANVSALCDKLGSDPGVFTRCMEMVADWELDNKEGFCNWMHEQCTGTTPGEHALDSVAFARQNLAQLEAEIREQELEALETYRKGLTAAPMLFKSMGEVKGIEDGAMTFVASEETEDRFGDIILTDGWDLKQYVRNPVYLFQHDHLIPPIGSVPRVWTEGKRLLNQVRWDIDDPFAKFIKGKYERGMMKAQSVGFRPIVFRQRPDGGKGLEFQKTELLEISAVSVPAHPAAILKALGPGYLNTMLSTIWDNKADNSSEGNPMELVVAALRKAFR